MTKTELNEILDKHLKWVRNEEGGERADLSDSDLSDSDLSDADLRRANLSDANLSDSNLRRANLRRANLRRANLSDADLSDSNLSDAYLSDSDLRRANLSDAYLAFNVCLAGVYGKPIYQSTLMGNNRRTLTLVAEGNRDKWRWFTGCFAGDELTLRERVEDKYGTDCDYFDAIVCLSSIAARNAHKFTQE